MKQTAELEEEEWRMVLGVLAQAPWNVANPLLMKLGEQLRLQQAQGNSNAAALPSQGPGRPS
jgi:hypothetical protein